MLLLPPTLLPPPALRPARWCAVEDAMARFSKDATRCLDLGKLPITQHNAMMVSEMSSNR